MTRNSFLALRITPLQRVVAEPITDPAEQAALDNLRRQHRGSSPGAPVTTTSGVLDLCRQVPEEQWPGLMVQLLSCLSPEDQRGQIEHLVARLPPEALARVEEELRAHLGKDPG